MFRSKFFRSAFAPRLYVTSTRRRTDPLPPCPFSARPSQEDFDAAAAKVKGNASLNNDQLLELYKYFKQVSSWACIVPDTYFALIHRRRHHALQGTVGDCNTERPGMFDFTGKAKWDAWSSAKGLSKEEAMTQYIATVQKFVS